MAGRLVRSFPVLVALVAAAGCGSDQGPRRVPGDGAPCSATMPGSASPARPETIRLGAATVTEQAWVLRAPAGSGDSPKEFITYSIRRGEVAAGAALSGQALLDAAAARAARGIALQDITKPDVAKVPTGAGDAVELRWVTGQVRNATRLLVIPGGYCEATILGARTDAEIAAYLGSVQARAGTP